MSINRPRLSFTWLTGALDHSLARLVSHSADSPEVRRLRWFWLDGLFANISLSFYAGFVGVFALAYGATNVQIGQLTGLASLVGLVALFPGAQAIKLMGGRRKTLVVVFGGLLGRLLLLAWFAVPWLVHDPGTAIAIIIAVNAALTFCNNFANPAWTAIVADLVPPGSRGRVFSHRNFAANLPALLVVPLAGSLILMGSSPDRPLAGYQLIFAAAFISGLLATYCFAQIDDPAPPSQTRQMLPLWDAARLIAAAPGFVSLVISTLIWNLGVQLVAPLLNIYLVNSLGATAAMVGWVAAASSLTALLTQAWVGRWVDRRGNIWVQGFLSVIIPWIPIAWMAATAAWQVIIINAVAGVLWTGYNLANFNLLLDLAPAEARAEANALFQLVITGSATLAPIAGGWLADTVGYHPTFILSALLRLVGAAAFLWWVARPAEQRARRLTAAPRGPGASVPRTGKAD